MIDWKRAEDFARIAVQANWLKAVCPELFNYLRDRDDLLRRIDLRLPAPGDPEAGAGFDLQAQVTTPLQRLPAGVADLA